jgi:pimeloyl-ACP methyl ester carboxylesterase
MKMQFAWRAAFAAAFAMGCASSTETAASTTTPPVPAETVAPTCAPIAAAEETMRVENDLGTIEGTLLVPESCGSIPVVLIVPGSGSSTRDGGAPKMYRLLAETLAAKGIASLRYDKAGIGASANAAPPMSEFLFERGAHDVAKLVEALHGDVRFSRVLVAGHSEGSELGILAASHAKVDAFVSIAGAGRPIGIILREQLAKNLGDEELLAKANEIIAALERGERVPASQVPQNLRNLFDPTLQPYMISWMKHDPAKDLAAAPIPRVLVVQGTTDVQVTTKDAELLAAARADAELVLVEGMNHTLKAATGDTGAEQKAAYTDGRLPLVPAFVDAISAFVLAE